MKYPKKDMAVTFSYSPCNAEHSGTQSHPRQAWGPGVQTLASKRAECAMPGRLRGPSDLESHSGKWQMAR